MAADQASCTTVEEEVAFWRGFIEWWTRERDDPVPPRAWEALDHADRKVRIGMLPFPPTETANRADYYQEFPRACHPSADQNPFVSRRPHFVEWHRHGRVTNAGPAPHLDYWVLSGAERHHIENVLTADWLGSDLETRAIAHAAHRPSICRRI